MRDRAKMQKRRWSRKTSTGFTRLRRISLRTKMRAEARRRQAILDASLSAQLTAAAKSLQDGPLVTEI